MKSIKALLLAASALGLGVAALAGAAWSAPQARSGQSEGSLAAGTAIAAEFDSTLDSKKAKVGDTVAAHVSEAVKSSDDRVILPKGTKLVGHITQSAAKSKGDQESMIEVYFDKAILKNGEEMPLKVMIQALAAAPSGGNAMGDFAGSAGPTNTSSSGGNMGGGNMGGNRTMGGNTGSTASPRPSGYPAGGAGTTADESAGAGGGTNSPDKLTAKSRGVYGINGVKLATGTANNVETSVISSDGKNVHLGGGTRMLLMSQS
ncbi:MAG TPA: hypothetical protein VGI16_07030 [Candidatus Acidoferrum sp.]|jgi:hypothetical protein